MDTVADLIGLIYDAVLDASRWSTFLGAFVRATNGRRGTMIFAGPEEADGLAIFCWHGWTDEDMRLYAERYADIDPWRLEGFARFNEGEISASHEICSEEQLTASIAYHEFYRPHDIHYGLGGAILRNGPKLSAILMQRSRADGPCGERELSILRPLMPHLRRAALLHGELASLRSQLGAFTAHLDRYPQAFYLTDADRRVLYVNAAGRELAEKRDGLSIEGGRLTLMSSNEDGVLRIAVRDIVSNRKAALARSEVARPSGKAPYRLLLFPLAPSGAIPLGVAQPAVAVLIIDPESVEPNPHMLQELFSLTPAEARVTASLAHGRSVEETAAELFVSVETVRTHTRRVLAKTGTRRQGELISLVLRAVPFRGI